jgi:hypothetical protein
MIRDGDRAGAPEDKIGVTENEKAAFAASAEKAGVPALIPGRYPRAWPVETFGREDGTCDFAFVFHGKWHRLPESALEHAATEVSVSSGAVVSTLNYVRGVALLLTALEGQKWVVLAPNETNSMRDKQNPDTGGTV